MYDVEVGFILIGYIYRERERKRKRVILIIELKNI
jgi:hypothetical protein